MKQNEQINYNQYPDINIEVLKDIEMIIKENLTDEIESGLRKGAITASHIESIHGLPAVEIYKKNKEIMVNMTRKGLIDSTDGKLEFIPNNSKKIENYSATISEITQNLSI